MYTPQGTLCRQAFSWIKGSHEADTAVSGSEGAEHTTNAKNPLVFIMDAPNVLEHWSRFFLPALQQHAGTPGDTENKVHAHQCSAVPNHVLTDQQFAGRAMIGIEGVLSTHSDVVNYSGYITTCAAPGMGFSIPHSAFDFSVGHTSEALCSLLDELRGTHGFESFVFCVSCAAAYIGVHIAIDRPDLVCAVAAIQVSADTIIAHDLHCT